MKRGSGQVGAGECALTQHQTADRSHEVGEGGCHDDDRPPESPLGLARPFTLKPLVESLGRAIQMDQSTEDVHQGSADSHEHPANAYGDEWQKDKVDAPPQKQYQLDRAAPFRVVVGRQRFLLRDQTPKPNGQKCHGHDNLLDLIG